MTEILKADPDPDCNHTWEHLGMTTICYPEIDHWCCRACKTFKHSDERSDPDGNGRTWWTKEWTMGPWTWEETVTNAYDTNESALERALDGPQKKDQRCPYCHRPVIPGPADSVVVGREGIYHLRCTQPPDESEFQIGQIVDKENNG